MTLLTILGSAAGMFLLIVAWLLVFNRLSPTKQKFISHGYGGLYIFAFMLIIAAIIGFISSRH